jgi:uncharacterized membrane protein YoaK (UPF0700 family)
MASIRDFGEIVLPCATGGSADAIAYIRFGTFVGAMTGNTVLVGIDIAASEWSKAGFHAGIVACFFAAVIVGRLVVLEHLPIRVTFLLNAALLAGAGLIESRWGAAISAAALGVQNAVVRKIGGVSVNTSFITGDLVRLGSDVLQVESASQRHEIGLLATVWLSYAAGALAGALVVHFGGYAMALPAILSLVVAGWIRTAAPPPAKP